MSVLYSGFYAAAAGMLTQQRVLNVLGNNLTNQNTPGYQAERVISSTFDYEYTMRKDAYGKELLGTTSPIRVISEVPTNFNSGYLEETGRLLDVAVSGAGFFNIQGQNEQIFLTRNGNFDIDEEGYLSLNGIGRVMGEKGEIQVESSDFIVGADGTVYSAEGDELGKLLITAPDSGELVKVSNGTYTVRNPENNLPFEQAELIQGSLCSSNVDIQRELTQVMEAQRAFQACSNALKTLHQMNQKSASQIAKL